MSGTDPITKQEVISFYELFLGRPPESADVVDRHVQGGATRSKFVANALASPEFYRHNFRALSRTIIGRAPTVDLGKIEIECERYELDQLFQHIQSVWLKLGEEQPHHSVLSQKQFAPGAIEANLNAFVESGRQEVAYLIEQLARLGLKIKANGCAIELGCGLGRVTRYLSGHSGQVIGYDISSSHLKLARDYMIQEQVSNVSFEHLSNIAQIDFAPHDLFYSKIVLQHNPPPVMAYFLDKIMSRTLPNGIVVFQIPTAIRDYTFKLSEYLAHCESIDNMEIHCLPQAYVYRSMVKNGILPLEVLRDGALTGFDKVSMTFVGQKLISGQRLR